MREDEELLGTGITSFHIKCLIYFCIGGFPGGSVGKESARNVETWVQSLGWEDPLEKEMANPLQYSCLGNPMDREAWQTKELNRTY